MTTEAKASDNHSEEPPEPPEWLLWVKAAVYIAIWLVFLQVAKRGVLANEEGSIYGRSINQLFNSLRNTTARANTAWRKR